MLGSGAKEGHVARRRLIGVAVASAGMIGLVRQGLSQEGVGYPVPTPRPLEATSDAQCSLAHAVREAAEHVELMIEYLRTSVGHLSSAVEQIDSILLPGGNAETLNRQLPIPKRFDVSIQGLLGEEREQQDAGIGSLETYGNYLAALRMAAREAIRILSRIIERQQGREDREAPLAEWDAETIRLFELVMAIQLLNASAVGFNT